VFKGEGQDHADLNDIVVSFYNHAGQEGYVFRGEVVTLWFSFYDQGKEGVQRRGSDLNDIVV
jgi:hypothetical protein